MIVIKIKTDNAAFHDGDLENFQLEPGDHGGQASKTREIARILRELADHVTRHGYLPDAPRDYNGNHVGAVTGTRPDRDVT